MFGHERFWSYKYSIEIAALSSQNIEKVIHPRKAGGLKLLTPKRGLFLLSLSLSLCLGLGPGLEPVV